MQPTSHLPRVLALCLVVGCAPPEEDAPDPFDAEDPADWDALFPAADAWESTGPGLGIQTFEEDDLWTACAFLEGDPATTADHHNLSVMYDGYLVMPWAPEDSGGGITLFDVSDPCDPRKVGEGYADGMRESHSLGFATVGDRTYLAVDYMVPPVDKETPSNVGGIGFWDITDPTAPTWASELTFDGFHYPDAYFRVTLSTFWQGSTLYVSYGLNGTVIVDVSDPLAPVEIGRVAADGQLVGSFHVWGNRAMASSAGLARTVLWDVSDPTAPQAVLGGDFEVYDEILGRPAAYYFANLTADYALFARKDGRGGPLLYDISDPSAPAFVGTPTEAVGDGGYVFEQNGYLFQGESDHGAVYDLSDPGAPTEVGRIDLKGDLDTVTPLGNLLIASVDSDADEGKASMIAPWRVAPDTQPPRGGMRSPEDGTTDRPVTSRIGIVFDEMLEPVSAHEGSARVVTDEGVVIEVMAQVQENILNLSPRQPLPANTRIHVQLPEGGLSDVSGNRLAETVQWSFSTSSDGA